MNLSRRSFISNSGLTIMGVAAWPALMRRALAADTIDIAMGGATGGAHVWFRPAGLLIQPGQTIRWTNHDAGNSHTATTYHPSLYGKQQRIPEGAKPWVSGFLLPGESFSVTLTVPGVYDYYCLPHEHAGMVGRIIVGNEATLLHASRQGQPPPDIALRAFPPIEKILQEKTVE